MSDDAIPMVPKRRRRGELELDTLREVSQPVGAVPSDAPLSSPQRERPSTLELDGAALGEHVPVQIDDDPPVPTIQGIVMARTQGGYMLIDVAIPEADLGRFATKIRPPEIYAIVRSQAEQRLDAMCESMSNGALSVLRTRGGMYEPTSAMAALVEEIATLHEAYWPGAAAAGDSIPAAIERFCRTGELTPEATGRQPTGDDRARLQRLAHHAGGWPGVVEPAKPFGGGAA
jgi:hypothetical protein